MELQGTRVMPQSNLYKIIYDPLKFVEKSDSNGIKHRYLRGIVSGTKIDGQGERITARGIQSLQEQGKAGTVLLYADRHGVAYTEDIGILVDSEVTPEGDWVCEFRLYDASDGVPQACLDTIEKMWKQINGLPPYKTPMQKGFSIEGYVPENGILSCDSEGRNRVIDQIILDGAVVVPRPAYRQSQAQAILKSLGENGPEAQAKVEIMASSFKKEIASDELRNNYFKFNYRYQDKLQEIIEDVMRRPSIKNKRDALQKVFSEYTDSMIELILQSKDTFGDFGNPPKTEDFQYLYAPSTNSRVEILKSLLTQVSDLEKTLCKEE